MGATVLWVLPIPLRKNTNQSQQLVTAEQKPPLLIGNLILLCTIELLCKFMQIVQKALGNF